MTRIFSDARIIRILDPFTRKMSACRAAAAGFRHNFRPIRYCLWRVDAVVMLLENALSSRGSGEFHELPGQRAVLRKRENPDINRGNDVFFDGYRNLRSVLAVVPGDCIPDYDGIERAGLNLHPQFVDGQRLEGHVLLDVLPGDIVLGEDLFGFSADGTGPGVPDTELQTICEQVPQAVDIFGIALPQK